MTSRSTPPEDERLVFITFVGGLVGRSFFPLIFIGDFIGELYVNLPGCGSFHNVKYLPGKVVWTLDVGFSMATNIIYSYMILNGNKHRL